jgi:hypothetical protein
MKTVTFIFFLFLIITYNNDIYCMIPQNPFSDHAQIQQQMNNWQSLTTHPIQTINKVDFTKTALKIVSSVNVPYHLNQSALFLILQCDWIFTPEQRSQQSKTYTYLQQTEDQQYYDLIIKNEKYAINKTIARISTQAYYKKIAALAPLGDTDQFDNKAQFSVNFFTYHSSKNLIPCLSIQSTNRDDLMRKSISLTFNANYLNHRCTLVAWEPATLKIQQEINDLQNYNLLCDASDGVHMFDRLHMLLMILLLVSTSANLALYYKLITMGALQKAY